MNSRPTLVFDVNETLLDLAALDPLFAGWFGDAGVRRVWFAQVLQLALTGGVIGRYADFSAVGGAALGVVAAGRDVTLPPDAASRLGAGMRALPPHPDSRPGLERLREAGARVVALTNNPLPVVEAQLEGAGLRDLFDEVLSGDEVRAQARPRGVPARGGASGRAGTGPLARRHARLGLCGGRERGVAHGLRGAARRTARPALPRPGRDRSHHSGPCPGHPGP